MKTIKLSFAQITTLVVTCVVLGMISVGYVAAQTASSTEEAATSTVEMTSGEVAGTSSTTEPVAAVSETEEEAQPEPVVAETQISAAIGDIATLEQEYMSKYGRYLQVMPGNTLPSNGERISTIEVRQGTTGERPDRCVQRPTWKGLSDYIRGEWRRSFYRLRPEAADLTYTIELPKPPVSATSTPTIQ